MTSKSNIAVWRTAGLVASLAAFVLAAALSFGQQLTGTLNGTTMDSTGAVVPNAKVTLKNEASGDMRTTISNATGYFTITAIQPGTYTVSVTSTGFKEWKQSGVVFNQGDSRTLPDIALQVGAVNETVEISAGALAVPTDNAEVSATVPEHMINDFPMGNRDAGELLKIMPGMAFSNGTSNGSGFSTKTVGSASGPVGQFSANGTQPSGAMSFMLDGANLVDPGNAGSQMANINQDMVQEVKVLMSDYSAEYAKGPAIFQAFSKSGGAKFHGEGYTYARNSALNSIDAYTHSQIANLAPGAQRDQSIAVAAPAESFYYFGGNVGGPVPKLANGNKKLFFWGGYEYMRQHPAGSIINYNTPTEEQLQGDFSNTSINGVACPSGTCALANQLKSTWGMAYNNPCCQLPAGANGSSIPTNLWDPNGAIYASTLPTPSSPKGGAFITPNAGNGWNNYQYVTAVPQNRWEATGKLDYAVGDNTKLTGSYSRQIEGDQKPVGIWWTPPWTLPYPSNVTQNYTSEMIMINGTHVFSPTTTNESVFTYTLFNSPATLSNSAAVSRSKLGMNIPQLFGSQVDQFPNVQGNWGGVFPAIGNMNLEGQFPGGGFGADKRTPTAYDNFTRVVGSHTLKVGAYFSQERNFQPSSGWGNGANGNFDLGGSWGSNETGNVVSDFLLGHITDYKQPSKDIVNYIRSNVWAIYGQDQWKMNRQLTLNYGLRLDHNGQWYQYQNGNGMAVWDPATYVNGTPTSPFTTNNTGLAWHSIDSAIPQSGWVSPLFYYEPRVGLAYDVFGNGKTVIRGGFASFRYNVSVNDVGGPASLSNGIFNYQSGPFVGYSNVSTLAPPSSVASNGSSFTVMQMGDNRTPYTNDWNIGVAQALPWRSVFEVTYVGNHSGNELINGNNGKLNDLNSNFPGAYWSPDPRILNTGGTMFANGTPLFISPSNLPCGNTYAGSATPSGGSNYINCGQTGPNGLPLSANYGGTPYTNLGTPCSANAGNCASFNENDYRRLTNYDDIFVLNHGGYANYNSLQASWQKQAGSVNFMINYTFSKVLGIRDGNSDQAGSNGNVVDPFSIRNNYGPLAYDHTNIANFTYTWNMPKFVHGNRFMEGAIDGWQLSGYTTYQSGAPLQANGTLQFSFAGSLDVPIDALAGTQYQLNDNSILLPNGLKSRAVNQATWFGTSQTGGGYASMLPLLSCNPQQHSSGQYFNPSCFTTPGLGQVGSFNWPYIKSPAYFDSDLGLYKSFKVTESKSLQFRVQATNFLNHPLPQFGLGGTGDETIKLQQDTPYTFPVSAMTANGLPAAAPVVNGNVDNAWPCDFAGAQNVTPASGPVTSCSMTLHAIAPTNTNTAMTGKPAFKNGQRVLTFAVKFYF